MLELRQESVVVQHWDLSCGAAALATLLTYQHGDPVPEKDIARELIARHKYIDDPDLVLAQQGFSLLDLKRFVERRGYRGVAFGRLTLDDLVERAPIIVPLSLNGYNHFVIFRGILGDRVLVADPAWGNRTLLLARFEQAWIEYDEIGKVGFAVATRDGEPPTGSLAPKAREFYLLR